MQNIAQYAGKFSSITWIQRGKIGNLICSDRETTTITSLKARNSPLNIIQNYHTIFTFTTDLVIPPNCKNVDLSVDHPLSDNVDSTWSTFFKDNETFLLQIDRDVRRLLPDISFFQMPTAYPCKLVVDSDTEIRLHHRVAPSVLSSANVERKGLGMKKVNVVQMLIN